MRLNSSLDRYLYSAEIYNKMRKSLQNALKNTKQRIERTAVALAQARQVAGQRRPGVQLAADGRVFRIARDALVQELILNVFFLFLVFRKVSSGR